MISIIIRTFNNEEFISESVESALNQDSADFEVVVINDGSTDNTSKILKQFNDPRLKIIHQENCGMIEAAYRGLEQAKGDCVFFLDGDDILTPDALTCLWDALKKSSAGFAYGDYYELKKGEKKYVSLKNIFNSLACGILWKRSVIEKVGFWDRSFILPEYDFLIRVMQKYKGAHVPKPLYTYRRHGTSMTADKNKVKQAQKQIFDKYGPLPGFKEY
ncbi:MAG TPA: glycosyltransferase [Candidatus Nanoarchaeia archaeon]|nr:glycosyltransferase [Candidatus Nanoarchaeia archaeon]